MLNLNPRMHGPAETLVPRREQGNWKTKYKTPPPPTKKKIKKMTHMRAKNIPTPCCSNSWVRKVQLNYVNAEMNVLCRTSTGDTCRDCSDISRSKRLCCIPLDVFNARNKNERIVMLWRLRCFYIWPANAHCSITLTFIRAV